MIRRAAICSAFISVMLMLVLLSMSSANAFVVVPSTTAMPASVASSNYPAKALFAKKKGKDIDPKIADLKSQNTNLFEATWNGGAFADMDDDAAKLAASKLKSGKDLGWTGPPLRRGGTRPRHRAYGGTTELPIQDKANYDPSSENCVEKWLSLDAFYALVKDDSPAADAVFVALAGGRSCAERDVAEQLLADWRSGPKGAFDENKFRASVKKGRTDLAIGWAAFTGANAFFASCIAFPTNPAAKALEHALANVQDMM